MATPVITPNLLDDAAKRRALAAGLQPPPIATPQMGPQLVPSLLSQPEAPATHVIPQDQVNATKQLLGDQTRLNYLKSSGSGIDQITKPVDAQGNPTGEQVGLGHRILGGLAKAGDIALSIAAPGIAQFTPGTTLNHQRLLGQQQGLVGHDLTAQGDIYQNQDRAAQADQRESLAQQEQAKAFALTHTKPNNGQILYDKDSNPIGFQDGSGNYHGPDSPTLDPEVQSILHSARRKQPTNAFELWQTQNPKGTAEQYLALSKPEKDANLGQQLLDAYSSGDTRKAEMINHVIHQTQVVPKIDVHTANAPQIQRGIGGPSLGGGIGEDVLNGLPAGLQNIIKATAAGDLALPTASARNPQAQAIRNAVLQYDPTYTDARYKGKQQFKTSGDADKIVQLATALEHGQRLHQNSEQLGFSPLLSSGIGPASTRYNEDVGHFTDEVGKLIKGSALTQGEEHENKKGLLSATHDSRSSAIDEKNKLLAGKVEALFSKYKTSTGEELPIDKFFDPQTAGRIRSLGVTAGSGGNGPKVGDLEDGHQFLGGNPGDPNSWKKVNQ